MDINASEIEHLFDAVPDVLFFVKDRERRYTHVNITIVHRLGLKSRNDAIGKRADEVYPGGMSAAYMQQDLQVLAGEVIDNLLELQIFPNHEPGWCLTRKLPWRVDGKIEGLIGISRDLDLGQTDSQGSTYERVRAALAYLNRHYSENVRMQALMDITGFSLSKLERAFRKVFQQTPQQVLTKLRVQMAMLRLRRTDSIVHISQACGFTDQSAFARQFKATVGMTPSEYRTLLHGSETELSTRTRQAAHTTNTHGKRPSPSRTRRAHR